MSHSGRLSNLRMGCRNPPFTANWSAVQVVTWNLRPGSEAVGEGQSYGATFLTCACCWCSVAQSCPTLCDPMDHSPPGSSVHGISQARVLEWVAIFFSRGSSQLRSPALQADSLPAEVLGKHNAYYIVVKRAFCMSVSPIR